MGTPFSSISGAQRIRVGKKQKKVLGVIFASSARGAALVSISDLLISALLTSLLDKARGDAL
jgi:hypothetical protein